MSIQWFRLLLVVALSSGCSAVIDSSRNSGSLPASQAQAGTSNTSQLSEVQKLTSLIGSPNRGERETSQQRLTEFALLSIENRRVVINALQDRMHALDLQDRLVLDEQTFLVFLGSCEVLGRLQAVEAIDLLIEFIYCSDGSGGEGVGHRPAEDALIAIGERAVPKLRDVLLDRSDKSATAAVRKLIIVRCLANIGGYAALQALEEAQRSETDKDALSSIESALATIRRTSEIKP